MAKSKDKQVISKEERVIEILTELDNIKESNEENFEKYALARLELRELGEKKAEEELCQKFIVLSEATLAQDSNNHEARMQLASAYSHLDLNAQELEQYAIALPLLQNELRIIKESGGELDQRMQLNMVTCMYHLKDKDNDNDEVLEALNQIIPVGVRNVYAHTFLKGLIFMSMHKMHDATLAFTQILEIHKLCMETQGDDPEGYGMDFNVIAKIVKDCSKLESRQEALEDIERCLKNLDESDAISEELSQKFAALQAGQRQFINSDDGSSPIIGEGGLEATGEAGLPTE